MIYWRKCTLNRPPCLGLGLQFTGGGITVYFTIPCRVLWPWKFCMSHEPPQGSATCLGSQLDYRIPDH